MNRTGVSFVLTVVVAGVIIGDNLLGAPWKFAVWGAGLSLPWVLVRRLIPRG
jgi:hypothetical protein